MGHNSVVSGHSKSTRIPQVDRLSMRPPELGCHNSMLGAIFFELPGEVFSTIIGLKLLQRISHFSLHHGLEFMKILEHLTFCMQ